MTEILSGHPAAPADLQPLIEIKLINREHDIDCSEHAEERDFVNESIPVALLQGIVKAVIPLVDQHGNADDGEFDDNHRSEQQTAGHAVFRHEIRTREPPYGRERRDKA